MNNTLKKIQEEIDEYKKNNPNESLDEISDSYHTFGELYKHRTVLLAIALNYIPYSWKARTHSDGTMFDDMFIVGAPTPSGMITYHCDNCYWNLFRIPELPMAPKFDGHTPNDKLDRLIKFIDSGSGKLINPSNIVYIERILTTDILPTFGKDDGSKLKFLSFYKGLK